MNVCLVYIAHVKVIPLKIKRDRFSEVCNTIPNNRKKKASISTLARSNQNPVIENNEKYSPHVNMAQ